MKIIEKTAETTEKQTHRRTMPCVPKVIFELQKTKKRLLPLYKCAHSQLIIFAAIKFNSGFFNQFLCRPEDLPNAVITQLIKVVLALAGGNHQATFA